MPVLSEFRGLLTGLSLVAALILLAVSVDLGIYGQPLLQSLRFHLGLLFLLLPIGLWVTGAPLRATMVAGVVLWSLGQGTWMLVQQQKARMHADIAAGAPTVSVLSFNVLGSNPTPDAVTDYMRRTSADLVSVMEAPGLKSGFAALADLYPYRIGCAPDASCDLAMLSKTPFENGKISKIGPFGRFRLITAETVMQGQRVTVVAMHLTKPYYDDASKEELWQIERVLKTLHGPLMLMGDFNAAAWSDQIDDFAQVAHLAPPPSYPATWPVELGALAIPIDNMFTRDGALITEITATPEAYGSNHRGLLARTAIAPTAVAN